MDQIYLDYAATTPVDNEVFLAMMPYYSEIFGNPSSIHRYGQKADAALETARQDIATILCCSPQEIVFTSGGTESDNLALRGAALAARAQKGANQILITPVEHHAVEKTAHDLVERYGFKVEYIPVDSTGKVMLADLDRMVGQQTAVISVIYANNEIGTVNPISEISDICHSKGVLFHTDAVQAAGSCDMDTQKLKADLISVGAHKFYGPKGIGFLYIRNPRDIFSIQTGGAHEWAMRAGTQNVPLIVGMAKALEIAINNRKKNNNHYENLRDHIIDSILIEIPGAQLTGHLSDRLPNHTSFVFPDTDGNQLVILLDRAGFACSSGSACKTGNPEPSGVLLAMGIKKELAYGSLRITVGRTTTMEDVNRLILILPSLVKMAKTN